MRGGTTSLNNLTVEPMRSQHAAEGALQTRLPVPAAAPATWLMVLELGAVISLFGEEALAR